MLPPGPPVMFPPGPPVIFPLGAVPLVWDIAVSLGVPEGAVPDSPEGVDAAAAAVLVEDVLAWVDDPVDELVHPATKTIPIRKIPIARAIPRFRFRLGTFFDDGEIEFIRVLLLVQ